MHSNDFIRGDWWLFRRRPAIFTETLSSKAACGILGVSPAVWAIEATVAGNRNKLTHINIIDLLYWTMHIYFYKD